MVNLTYSEEDFCWRCGCLLNDDEQFMGTCDDCLEKETDSIEGFPKKPKFDDEERK